jgi:hypothetical protein
MAAKVAAVINSTQVDGKRLPGRQARPRGRRQNN